MKRLNREDYFMKKLRTFYRYGLNQRAKNMMVKYQLENHSFLYLELSNDMLEVETT